MDANCWHTHPANKNEPTTDLVYRLECRVGDSGIETRCMRRRIPMQFGNSPSSEFTVIGCNSRRDNSRSLACDFQLHPQVTDRPSRPQRATVNRVTGSIHVHYNSHRFRLGRPCITVLCRELTIYAANRLDFTVLIEQTQ